MNFYSIQIILFSGLAIVGSDALTTTLNFANYCSNDDKLDDRLKLFLPTETIILKMPHLKLLSVEQIVSEKTFEIWTTG